MGIGVSKIRRPIHGPEWHIRADVIQFLETRGWLVEIMVGSAYQTGIPDLYCYHRKWGERWIDVKQSKHYTFTKAQRIKWPKWEAGGIGIWILTAATQEEYDKLFKPPNWRVYWKPQWKVPSKTDIDKLLEEME